MSKKLTSNQLKILFKILKFVFGPNAITSSNFLVSPTQVKIVESWLQYGLDGKDFKLLRDCIFSAKYESIDVPRLNLMYEFYMIHK
jgi:hypothetical protein